MPRRRPTAAAKAKKETNLARAEVFTKVQAICEILDTIPGSQRRSIRDMLCTLYEGSCYEN